MLTACQGSLTLSYEINNIVDIVVISIVANVIALLLVFIVIDQHTAVWIVYINGVVQFHLRTISPTLQQKSACRFAYSACDLTVLTFCI